MIVLPADVNKLPAEGADGKGILFKIVSLLV